MSSRTLSLLLLLSACVPVRMVMRDLDEVDELIKKTQTFNGDRCAPTDLANAESSAHFARLAFAAGDAPRAQTHTDAAWVAAKAAWKVSESCGGTDYDADGIVDVLDACPKEAEDKDGVKDEDGCPDLDPYADADADGVINIDDACIDVAEDFDGHNDDDGCPETSDDTDGDGIIDALDKCPADAEDLDGFKDGDGCPDTDNDVDGVVDLRDGCPNAAEDLDDFQDSDGCPDIDNDGDGVDDTEDRCPNVAGMRDNRGCPGADRDLDGVSDANDKCPDDAETRNGYQDEDGCPDAAAASVRLTSERIELPKPVRFVTGVTGNVSIEPEALPMLDEVAQLLRNNTSLRLRVEAHSDLSGADDALIDLTDRQARLVKDYLVAKGVPSDRLESRGYGATRPVDTNRTDTGRARNRRIELVLLK